MNGTKDKVASLSCMDRRHKRLFISHFTHQDDIGIFAHSMFHNYGDLAGFHGSTAEATRVADDLTRLIETANAPIFGVDLKGRVTEWDAIAESLSGFSKQETLGQPSVEKFITEDYKERVEKVLNEALLGKETANFEFPLITKDGRRFDVLLNATTRRDATTRPCRRFVARPVSPRWWRSASAVSTSTVTSHGAADRDQSALHGATRPVNCAVTARGDYGAGEIGAGFQLILVGVDVGVDFLEIIDFVGGIFTLDMMGDDF